MLLKHGVRSCLEYAKSFDLERARALSNPRLAPHLEFVDTGGHGYAKVRLTGDEMRTEFVCIPRPITRSGSADGGPLRYRVVHTAHCGARRTAAARQHVLEGDSGPFHLGRPPRERGWYWQALCVATALACGLLIGIERGFDLRGLRAGTRIAGVRTFTLLGLGVRACGPCRAMVSRSSRARSSRLRGGPGDRLRAPARAQAARRDHSRRRDDNLGARLHRGLRQAGLRDRGRGVVTLILALKAELHGFLDKLDEDDVKALARYAVIAGAVLPFLPSGHYGPLGAWNPQKLWLVVVLVTGFSFLGYVANRIFGERHGTIATALIGGAYSSTAVTQSLAQRLGSEQQGGAEPAGIALATAVMYLRVPVLIGSSRRGS